MTTTAPSTTMPKSNAPSESRLAGILFRSRQIEANNSEKGMVSATISAPRDIAEKEKQNDGDEQDAFTQIVQHGVRRVVHQVAAIQKRNDLHSRRQDMFVQFLHLGVNSFERGIRIRLLCEEHNAFHNIVVVDDRAVFSPERFADLSQADAAALASQWRYP